MIKVRRSATTYGAHPRMSRRSVQRSADVPIRAPLFVVEKVGATVLRSLQGLLAAPLGDLSMVATE